MTSRLPVIVGFGGYNAAGRSSFHHGFRRTVIESMDTPARQQTLAGLAVMMKLVKVVDGHYQDDAGNTLSLAEIDSRFAEQILASTLVRRIEKQHLDVDAAHWQKTIDISATAGQPLSFITLRKHLPEPLPANWSIEELDGNEVRVTLHDSCEFKVDSYRALPVKSAGQLPSGFEPSELYNARFHPRGLAMTIVGVTDALRATGIDWQTIMQHVAPDEVAAFVKFLQGRLSLDAARLYVTGHSMGGSGALHAATTGVFAACAAVAPAGGARPRDLMNVPVWAFHGRNDVIVPAAISERLITAMHRAGASPDQARLTLYDEAPTPPGWPSSVIFAMWSPSSCKMRNWPFRT